MATRSDAAGDYLNEVTNLPTITGFTMMGWFYFITSPGASSWAGFMHFGNNTGGYSVYIFDSVNRLRTWNGLDNGPNTGTQLSLNTWYHVAITVAGTGANQFLTYLNGTLDTTHDGSAVPASEMRIFDSNDGNAIVDARGAAIKIYDAVLTANEIRNEMWSYVPRRWADLDRWTPGFAGATERLRDYGPNGFDWVEAGTLTDEAGPPIPWDIGTPHLTIPGVAAGVDVSLGVVSGSASVEDLTPTLATGLSAVLPLIAVGGDPGNNIGSLIIPDPITTAASIQDLETADDPSLGVVDAGATLPAIGIGGGVSPGIIQGAAIVRDMTASTVGVAPSIPVEAPLQDLTSETSITGLI